MNRCIDTRARKRARLFIASLALLAPTAVVTSAAPAAAAVPDRYERLVVKKVNQVRTSDGLVPVARRSAAATCYDAVAERWAQRINRAGRVLRLPAHKVSRQCPGRVVATVAARTRQEPQRLVSKVLHGNHRVSGDDRSRHVGVGVRRDRRGVWSVVLVIGGPRKVVAAPPEVTVPAPKPADPTPTPPAEQRPTQPAPAPVTAPVTAPPTAPSEPGSVSERVRAEIFSGTNAERTSRGISALRRQSCLDDLAQRHAERMAATGSFAHQDLSPVLRGCGLRSVGENIAYNHTTTGASHVQQWMNSSGHRANLLNTRYTLIGIGAARTGSGRMYTVQLFGS